MWRNEVGELCENSFHVEFSTDINPVIQFDTVEPWVSLNGPRVNGQLDSIDVGYARESGFDAIEIYIWSRHWWGEMTLDRQIAGALLESLVKAINAYDAEAEARAADPHHYFLPNVHDDVLMMTKDGMGQKPENN